MFWRVAQILTSLRTLMAKEQRRGREEPLNHHKVDMLPVHQVAALMNEAREENLALRMQIRGSRPEIIPSAPEDRYKVV